MASALSILRPQAFALEDLTRQIGVGVTSHQLNIVCVGAHPDDPETGCGGTLARLANEGIACRLCILRAVRRASETDMAA